MILKNNVIICFAIHFGFVFPETIQLSSSISNSCLKAEAW